MSRTRVNYKKIYEEFHGMLVPKGMHIHHSDGNSHNNEISNLIMVTPDQHVELHKKLGHKIIGNFIKKANNQLGIPCSPSKKENIAKSLRNRRLNDQHKIKIAKKLGPIRPFIVFNKLTGALVGKFSTKGSCFSKLNTPPSKIRKCLSKSRHSIGDYFFIYEDELPLNFDVVTNYKNIIKQSLKTMGESQRKRYAKKDHN